MPLAKMGTILPCVIKIGAKTFPRLDCMRLTRHIDELFQCPELKLQHAILAHGWLSAHCDAFTYTDFDKYDKYVIVHGSP